MATKKQIHSNNRLIAGYLFVPIWMMVVILFSNADLLDNIVPAPLLGSNVFAALLVFTPIAIVSFLINTRVDLSIYTERKITTAFKYLVSFITTAVVLAISYQVFVMLSWLF